jgi:hypothetical protein
MKKTALTKKTVLSISAIILLSILSITTPAAVTNSATATQTTTIAEVQPSTTTTVQQTTTIDEADTALAKETAQATETTTTIQPRIITAPVDATDEAITTAKTALLTALNERKDATLDWLSGKIILKNAATTTIEEKNNVKQSLRLKNLVINKEARQALTELSAAEKEQLSRQLFLTISNGKMTAIMPKEASEQNKITITLQDSTGKDAADIVAELEDTAEATLSTTATTAERAAASALTSANLQEKKVKRMKLISKEKKLELRTAKDQTQKLKARIEVDLNSLNEGSALDISMTDQLDAAIERRFSKLAEKNKLKVIDRGGVIVVTKTELKNKQEVEKAEIIFSIEKSWLGKRDKKQVKILRYDEETDTEQMLPTTYVGTDSEGYLIFRGESANGLSTFAVFMTDTITPDAAEADTTTETTDASQTTAGRSLFSTRGLKTFLIPLLIIVTVGAAFVSSVLMSSESKAKKRKH